MADTNVSVGKPMGGKNATDTAQAWIICNMTSLRKMIHMLVILVVTHLSGSYYKSLNQLCSTFPEWVTQGERIPGFDSLTSHLILFCCFRFACPPLFFFFCCTGAPRPAIRDQTVSPSYLLIEENESRHVLEREEDDLERGLQFQPWF